MNMTKWLSELIAAPRKKPAPVMSFPSAPLLGVTVKQLIDDPELQARGMALVAQRTDAAAAFSMMDLSLEAEAFGCGIRQASDNDVPTVVRPVVEEEADADRLQIPPVGAGRTGTGLRAIRLALERITDRPVFCGVIGPFSLAGRLMGVSDTLVNCIEEPDMVQKTMAKATAFLIDYIRAYKALGCHGVCLAEPLTGLLSPALAEEFSEPYCRQLVEAVQDDSFLVVYHNCGDAAVRMIDSILRVGAGAYHFGNSVSMADVMEHMPADRVAMGNVDPARQFCSGTPASVAAETRRVMDACGRYPNFVISSGCDIPYSAPWENIDAFFAAATAE